MHVENLGIYRGDDGAWVFDVNDFDDATIAPLRFDVVRALTSILLASAANERCGGERAIVTALALVDGYADRLATPAADPAPMPPPLEEAFVRASAQRQRDILGDRVYRSEGRYHFIRGPHHVDLPASLVEYAPGLLQRYLGVLGDRAPRELDRICVDDVVWRVAGTGNLGYPRLAYVLRRGRWVRLVELKACRPSAVGLAYADTHRWHDDAERVLEAATVLPRVPAHRLAAIRDESTGLSLVGRRLVPQGNKIDASTLRPRDMRTYARLVGDRLGSAHLRGLAKLDQHADDSTRSEWFAPYVRAALVDAAVRLAGLHHAAHIAYARLVLPLEATQFALR
jgi:uncharacterized protein (DUF2252 family)